MNLHGAIFETLLVESASDHAVADSMTVYSI